MAAFLAAKLGDCVDLLAGFAFKSERFTDKADDIALVKGENVSQGHILWDISKRWPTAEWSAFEKYHLRTDDVVVAMDRPWVPAGLKWAYIRGDAPRALLVQRCSRLRSNTPKLDQGFLRFVIGGPGFESYVKPITTGVNVPHISGRQILDYEFLLPPIPIQRRIAGILSAYDDLIENSQRRIKILETMARTLYREWFVHFRFPGHENYPRVASPLGEIPEGWEVTTLGENLAALESGKRPKGGIRDVEDGVPSIGAENINGIGQHDFAGEKFVPREFFQDMRKGVVRDRDVAIYKDGAYIGKSSYFRDGFPHIECCVNEHVFLLRSSGVRLRQNALYLWLQEPDTVQTIRSKNANAAQPGINQQTVNGLVLALPDSKTAAHFDWLVEPLFAEVINLAKRIQNLRRTRDLLLPRLLSGQIALDELEAA
jgi:type I restriction enzyme S subunit